MDTPPVAPRPPAQDLATRRAVTFAFWAIALLGVPYWWTTTDIERRPLPTADLDRWLRKAATSQPSPAQPCYLRPSVSLSIHSPPSRERPRDAQRLLNAAHLDASCIDLAPSGRGTAYALVEQPGGAMSGREASVDVNSTDEQRTSVAERLLGVGAGARHPDPRVVKFAPRYKLVFSLLNEDATQGGALLEWDIQELLNTHLRPLVDSLAPVHAFIVETRVQYFAPLSIAVKPATAAGAHESGTVVDEADLRAFVNSADWNMAPSITLEPVLNFILYVPSPANRPMRIQTTSGSLDSSNAFISPQWGGVVIHSPSSTGPSLSSAFSLFSYQLHTLLGVPPSPSNSPHLEQWQVDAMVRRRLGEAATEAIETLHSITKLVNQLPNMRVGKQVQKGVRSSLSELDAAELILPTSPTRALAHAAAANELAERAYFDPTMLALLYFPDEHKYAVYTPLFGPVAVPMIAALVKEFKQWRERKRRKAAAARDKDGEHS